jgi:PRTRC genetic system protein C
MEVHRLEREFLYNGVKLLDTTPAMNRRVEKPCVAN